MNKPDSSCVFIIKVRPVPGVDPIKALRRLLKALLRQYGLKCTQVSEQEDGDERRREKA
jgi:hypothetical protein